MYRNNTSTCIHKYIRQHGINIRIILFTLVFYTYHTNAPLTPDRCYPTTATATPHPMHHVYYSGRQIAGIARVRQAVHPMMLSIGGRHVYTHIPPIHTYDRYQSYTMSNTKHIMTYTTISYTTEV